MNRLQILLYLYETVRRIPCSYRCQLRLGKRVYHYISAHLQENPGAGIEELKAALGEPAELAQSMLEYVEEEKRALEFRRKSWARRAIVVLLSGAAFAAGGFCALYIEHMSRDKS